MSERDHPADIPEGLVLRHREEVSDRVDKRSTALELLAVSGAIEVTRQRIEAGKYFNLYDSSDWVGFEFMYVLSGLLKLETASGQMVSIRDGDYFHHNGLPEKAFFHVEEDVELLIVCTPPSFHLTRDDMQGMMEMARTVEEKDATTAGHCSRLERLAILTGERLNLHANQLVDLSYAAYLHDIGKIRVPDEILNKEGALTAEEQAEIRKHTAYGGEILAEKEFLANAAKAVVSHHENFDGSGYPEGLKGDEIPIEARVIRVVDTYDAITSARPYQGALSKEEAIRELVMGVDKQFDRRVVGAFIEVVSDGQVDDLGD